MKCEKCQDVGFIDLDKAGLLTRFCDCEIGKQVEANKRAIYGIPEEEEGKIKAQETIKEVINDSESGIGLLDTDIGSGNPSEPKQPKKQKAKRKARKRTK